MWELIISLLIVTAVAIAGIIVIKAAVFRCNGQPVEIIIDGNSDEEQLEKLVISTKLIADKYFVNSRIYIHGGCEKIVEMLCKTHEIYRK